jgi:uncharacterized membrane protein
LVINVVLPEPLQPARPMMRINFRFGASMRPYSAANGGAGTLSFGGEFKWRNCSTKSMEAIMPNPKSTLQIAGHPIHPMLVPFPIAFFVAVLACDIAYRSSSVALWATAALWLLGAGLVMAALAALAGLTDFFGEPRIRDLNDARWHAGINVVAVLLSLYNFYIRYPDPAAAGTGGLFISLVVVLLLLVSGWKGWEMVYRHRVGVSDQPPPL